VSLASSRTPITFRRRVVNLPSCAELTRSFFAQSGPLAGKGAISGGSQDLSGEFWVSGGERRALWESDADPPSALHSSPTFAWARSAT
jgi:hypothetical protein